MANVGSVTTGFFPETKEGFTTTTSGTVSSGAGSVGFNSTAGYTNGAYGTWVIDPSDVTKKQVFTGLIDTGTNTITGVQWTEGTNQTHTAGATVVDYETATAWNLQRKGLLVGHNDNGTHKAFTEANIISTTNIQDNAVSNAKIVNAAVTPNKLSLGAQVGYVAASETRASATYGALTTASAVTVTIGANGIALVILSVSNMFNNTTNGRSFMSYTISGANTAAASDDMALSLLSSAGSVPQAGFGITFTLTGLTPGSTTFTTQFRSLGTDIATFVGRRITVIPL